MEHSLRGISGGNIVGFYYDSNPTPHGFLYNGSTYTTIDDPLAVFGTFASGIDGNNIVGSYNAESSSHGYLATVPEPSSVVLAAAAFSD